MTPLAYRHAIITGGSSGIGLALACRLAPVTERITLLARDPQRLESAATAVRSAGAATVLIRTVDVVFYPEVERTVAEAVAEAGPADLVIASAGQVSVGRFPTLDDDAYDADMRVNYFGSLNLARAVAAEGRITRGGRLVFLSSGAGLVGVPGYAAYAPSKFAVRGLAEVLRLELKPRGIAVSVVFPPDTDTPQLQRERAQRPAETDAVAAAGGAMSADAVAGAILHGIARGRFAIAPGLAMRLLLHLHSAIHAPWRAWCDRVVRRHST